ncbi:MAG TPA: hypothetical protein VD884_03135 [Ohtaekwangia sp.]|nr:hypothetical protein [Ohtaekwangia sp.]
MYFLTNLFLYIAITASAFLLMGLFKPWVMLWWEDIQNRRKVIRLYGVIALLAYSVYCITNFFK